MAPELTTERLRFRDWRESDPFHAFYREKGLPRLVSDIDPENKTSLRVAEKLDARPDGEFLLHGKNHLVYLHTQH